MEVSRDTLGAGPAVSPSAPFLALLPERPLQTIFCVRVVLRWEKTLVPGPAGPTGCGFVSWRPCSSQGSLEGEAKWVWASCSGFIPTHCGSSSQSSRP